MKHSLKRQNKIMIPKKEYRGRKTVHMQ